MRLDRTSNGHGFELLVPELTIHPGEKVAVVGESGCGKSTLLDMLAMVLSPSAATEFRFAPGTGRSANVVALWEGGEVDRVGRLRGRHIGYVLQTGGLIPFLNVAENIRLPGRLFGCDDPEYIAALTDRLGLSSHLRKRPSALSVGERQRVAIIRALAHRPAVVLADEPTASVDPVNADIIMAVLVELVDELGVTAIVASHDAERVESHGFRILDFRIEREKGLTRSIIGG